MKKAIRWLDVNFEPVCMMVLFYLMLALVFVQVILRFCFQSGFAWAEEISRFLFVWLMYIGFSYAIRNSANIRMEFVRRLFPDKMQKVIMIIIDILLMFFISYMFYASLDISKYYALRNKRAETIDISMNALYFSAVVGFFLMFLRIIQSIKWKIINFNKDFKRFENVNGEDYNPSKIFFNTEKKDFDNIEEKRGNN